MHVSLGFGVATFLVVVVVLVGVEAAVLAEDDVGAEGSGLGAEEAAVTVAKPIHSMNPKMVTRVRIIAFLYTA
ncbi:hypothetical protein ACBP46_02655 [Paenalcaligenes hominis]|uniref:hypothetical protein n=1 Tax=Paenalcaligenes hominis TaxID=643674 RepID=UPI0035231DD9